MEPKPKVGKFLKNGHIVKDNLFATPPLFDLIQSESGTDWKEMYQVFNMGHRLEAYLDESRVQELIDVANSFGMDAQIIGRVEESEEPALTIIVLTEHSNTNYEF